jgi:hypothetical protein
MEARDVHRITQRLASMEREDIVLLPLAAVGITRALVEVILIPTVKDLGHKLLNRTVEPWEDKFFNT